MAFSGRIGGLRSAFGRIAAAAVLGGTSSAITGGKFANGAVTGAFSRAFNEEIHPFIEKFVSLLRQEKFWNEFKSLSPDEFRTIFPNLAAGAADDYEIELRKLAIYDSEYRSELPGQVPSAARDANDLLREYSVGRVTGIVGARGRIVSIIGQAGRLSDSQMRLVKDAIGIKAFADQQSSNASQLSDLSRILIESNQSIDQVLRNLQDQ